MKDFSELWSKAYAAGMAAGNGSSPNAMVVSDGKGHQWYVADGVCGFAWVTVRPGNSPFANWAKAKGFMSKSYEGGVKYWVGEFGQSMQRKEAFASAMADVLSEAGIKAYAGSRMD